MQDSQKLRNALKLHSISNGGILNFLFYCVANLKPLKILHSIASLFLV